MKPLVVRGSSWRTRPASVPTRMLVSLRAVRTVGIADSGICLEGSPARFFWFVADTGSANFEVTWPVRGLQILINVSVPAEMREPEGRNCRARTVGLWRRVFQRSWNSSEFCSSGESESESESESASSEREAAASVEVVEGRRCRRTCPLERPVARRGSVGWRTAVRRGAGRASRSEVKSMLILRLVLL